MRIHWLHEALPPQSRNIRYVGARWRLAFRISRPTGGATAPRQMIVDRWPRYRACFQSLPGLCGCGGLPVFVVPLSGRGGGCLRGLCRAAGHLEDRGPLDHGGVVGGEALVVAGAAAPAGDPGVGALDDPAAGQDLEAFRSRGRSGACG